MHSPLTLTSRLTTLAAASVLALATAATPALAQSGIVLNATGHNFVSVPEGTTAPKYGVHVTNNSGSAFAFQLALEGSPSFTQVNNCPASLPAGNSCEIVFSYTAPNESKWETATFTIAANGVPFTPGNSGVLRAHAVPGGTITLNSHKHNFGEIGAANIATVQPFGLIIANGTGTSVPFSYRASGDSASYNIVNNCPPTIAPAGQCSLIFSFVPKAKGWQQMTVALNTGSASVADGNTVTLVGKTQ
jgi:hypothetical protein